jgi:hypothetical protein
LFVLLVFNIFELFIYSEYWSLTRWISSKDFLPFCRLSLHFGNCCAELFNLMQSCLSVLVTVTSAVGVLFRKALPVSVSCSVSVVVSEFQTKQQSLLTTRPPVLIRYLLMVYCGLGQTTYDTATCGFKGWLQRSGNPILSVLQMLSAAWRLTKTDSC